MPVKTNVKISTLGYVIVYVKDTKVSVPFYRDVLGMALKLDDEGWVEFETGAATLALHAIREGTVPDIANAPNPVFSVENFAETVEALRAAGVKFARDPHKVCEVGPDKIGMSVDFKDPDGNLLSVFGYVTE